MIYLIVFVVFFLVLLGACAASGEAERDAERIEQSLFEEGCCDEKYED